ncbi:CPBP family intramembrane metalloprotease [Eubacteriales bacterium OttesenSCG-928-K08]|nr:CPBP family intramembrane metalloprotease [Eubacteriales bacterium OttesenSCG-928-K08]
MRLDQSRFTGKQKLTIDCIVLATGPVMLLVSMLVSVLGVTNALQLHMLNALVVKFCVLCLPAVLFIRANGGRAKFGFVRMRGICWAYSFFLGMGMFFLTTALNSLLLPMWQGLGIAQTGTSLPNAGEGSLPVLLLFVAIIPAFAEETLFRGALFRVWESFDPHMALLHSALVFALLHFQPSNLLTLFALGLVLGWVNRRTGSVFAPMVLHCAYNGASLILRALVPEATATASVADAAGVSSSYLLLALIFAVMGTVLFYPAFRGLRRFALITTQGPPKFTRVPLEQPARRSTARSEAIVLTLTYIVLIVINIWTLLAKLV